MRVLQRFWNEDGGFVISTEAIIILTMLICAAVVSWQAVRMSIVTELADIAEAIGALDQSYSFAGFVGHAAACHGSTFDDQNDFCDEATACVQVGLISRCITFNNGAKENGGLTAGNDAGAP